MILYSTDPKVSAQNTYVRIFFGLNTPDNMRKQFFVFLVAFFLIATFSQTTVDAAEKTSAPSATLALASQEVEIDNRGKILKEYLAKYNSPMTDSAEAFIEQADKYNLDWKLVVSIAGVESYYGKHIPPYSYNGWGFGVYGNNVRRFASWEDGIETVSKALREEYMDARGHSNIYEIGSTYAADPRWPYKVQHFVDQLTAFETEAETTNDALSISI